MSPAMQKKAALEEHGARVTYELNHEVASSGLSSQIVSQPFLIAQGQEAVNHCIFTQNSASAAVCFHTPSSEFQEFPPKRMFGGCGLVF